MKEATIILNKAPYGRVFSVEGIRLASGLAAMDIETKLVFTKDSVYSLLKHQDTAAVGMPGLGAGFDILTMSSVPVLVIIEDLHERGITEDDLIPYPGLKAIRKEEFAKLVAESECSFRF